MRRGISDTDVDQVQLALQEHGAVATEEDDDLMIVFSVCPDCQSHYVWAIYDASEEMLAHGGGGGDDPRYLEYEALRDTIADSMEAIADLRS